MKVVLTAHRAGNEGVKLVGQTFEFLDTLKNIHHKIPKISPPYQRQKLSTNLKEFDLKLKKKGADSFVYRTPEQNLKIWAPKKFIKSEKQE